MKASDLSVGDIGKRFRSPLYRDNNKTSLPIGQNRSRRLSGEPAEGTPRLVTWILETLYAHENGNIKINNLYHLRVDTEIERMA